MWDKDSYQSNQNDDTPAEGNTKNSTSECSKTSDLQKNESMNSEKLVVATYIANEDGGCAGNRGIADCPTQTETERSDITDLLSIVSLCDGPSTSKQCIISELNPQPTVSMCVSNTPPPRPNPANTPVASAVSPAIKEVTNSSALTISIDSDQLPYENKNTNVKTPSPKPTISVKYFSPISRVQPVQNDYVPPASPSINEDMAGRTQKNSQSDNVAGPRQLLSSNENLNHPPATDRTTASCAPTPEETFEELTSASESRPVSPANSSVTSVSTFRAARSAGGRRIACVRHMRRAPKEPEEYVDALFPHIRNAHNQIRQALLHAPLTDVKDNALLKRKMFEVIRIYISGCKHEFERIGTSLILCRRLKRNIVRLLDLFDEICSSSREDPTYLYHISQLVAVYNSLEIRVSFNLTRLQKCAVIHRIAHVINKYLAVNDESLTKVNILRMFLRMPDMYAARFIMEPLFNTFLAEIPTSSNTWCQRELPDKTFVQYIIVLHLWKEMLRDPLEQVELITRAQHFMCPTKTLHTNPMYANHLPTIHTRKHAVKDILNSLKYFHDLRNAAICDDILQDNEDDIEVVLDDVINTTPSWDFGITYATETKHQKHINRRVVTSTPAQCVDLTLDDDDDESSTEHLDNPLNWLTELKERASDRVQTEDTTKVICLDSDSDGELFSGSILDPSESYQDCDAVDTDYTSLDGSASDEKAASEDDTPPTSGIATNALRTYLAPKSKKQINFSEDIQTSTSRTPLHGETSCVRPGDDYNEGEIGCDKITLAATNKPSRSMTRHSEGTLPLIVNTFTVSGKQNMHLLNSPRISLEIGPERFGYEDMERQDACSDNNALRRSVMEKRNRLPGGRDCVHDVAERSADVYESDDDDDEEEYHTLPSASSPNTTNLGKVIYSQALLPHNRRLLPEEEEFESTNKRREPKEKDNIRHTEVREHVVNKPVKKQVKFNDNPIGPTRRPNAKVPIKPAIHLSKTPANNQPPAFAHSPQPRYASPSSSTSSTTESLKQMAQKGRSFVGRFKIRKSIILPKAKSSSTIIINSDEDDDIIDVGASAKGTKSNLTVSTQPIQSKKAHKKVTSNQSLSVLNSNICKNSKCKRRSKSMHGPKDISSTNCISNKNVEIMHTSDVDDNSTLCKYQEILEVEKRFEMEEQNSNVSTTTGPNLETNIADEHKNSEVTENCIKNQTLAIVESTSTESCGGTSLRSSIGIGICTSSTEAMLQKADVKRGTFSPHFDGLEGGTDLLGLTIQNASISKLNCTSIVVVEKQHTVAESNDSIGLAKVLQQISNAADESECRQSLTDLCDENISDSTKNVIESGLNVIKTHEIDVVEQNAAVDLYPTEMCGNVVVVQSMEGTEKVKQLTALEIETTEAVRLEPLKSVVAKKHAEPLWQSMIDSEILNEKNTKFETQNTPKKLKELCKNSAIVRNTENAENSDTAAADFNKVICTAMGVISRNSETTLVAEILLPTITKTSLQDEYRENRRKSITTLDVSTPSVSPTMIEEASDKVEVQTNKITEKVEQSSKIFKKQIDQALISDCEEKTYQTVLECLEPSVNIAADANSQQITETVNKESSDVIDNKRSAAEITQLLNAAKDKVISSHSQLEIEENLNATKKPNIEVEKETNLDFEKASIEIRSINANEAEINEQLLLGNQKMSHGVGLSENIGTAMKTDLLKSPAFVDDAESKVKHSTEKLDSKSPTCTENAREKVQQFSINVENEAKALLNEHAIEQQSSLSENKQKLSSNIEQITAHSVAAVEAISEENTESTAVKEACKNTEERSEYLEITTKLEHPINVQEEIFSASTLNNSSDGLVRLVAAVKAVEALNLAGKDLSLMSTCDNVEEIISNECTHNLVGGAQTIRISSENSQTTDYTQSDLTAKLAFENTSNAVQAGVVPKCDETSTNDVDYNVEKKVEPEFVLQVVSNIEVSKVLQPSGIVICGDKSPETNLDRLAQAVLLTEAASQKYCSNVADRVVSEIELVSKPLNVEMLATTKSEIFNDARENFANNIEQATEERELDIDTSTKNKSKFVNIDEINNSSNYYNLRNKSTAAANAEDIKTQMTDTPTSNDSANELSVVEKSSHLMPIDYEIDIIKSSESIPVAEIKITPLPEALTVKVISDENYLQISTPSVLKKTVMKKEINKLKEQSEQTNFDTSSLLNSANISSDPPLTHNTGQTFHSSFENFISSLKTKGELKPLRKSPRTSTKADTNKDAIVIEKRVQHARVHATASLVSSVQRNTSITKPLTFKKCTALIPQNSEIYARSEQEQTSVDTDEARLRKRYSLRRSEQWKVVKNTSLRCSPPNLSNDTKKTLTQTLAKRCIKIRLARAKIPVKVEKVAKEPISDIVVKNLETQFGDVSHRPITRRLAAALNSSLQMETENAVIEPIKPLMVRSRKAKPKSGLVLEHVASFKRQRCENVTKMLCNKNMIEPKLKTKEVVRLEIPLEELGKKEHSDVDATIGISLKPSDAKEEARMNIASELPIVEGKSCTEPVIVPVKNIAEFPKIGDTKQLVNTGEKETNIFENVFIKPVACTEAEITGNCNTIETKTNKEQPIEEVVATPAVKNNEKSFPIGNNINVTEAKDMKEEKGDIAVDADKNENEIITQAQEDSIVTQPKDVLLTVSVENSNLLPESTDANLVDISSFRSLTLQLTTDACNPTNLVKKCQSKSVDNFPRISEFPDEDSTIDLNITTHMAMSDKHDDLNNTECINILKTNMEADKLLEEYNHSARIIANANLKIPLAAQTPPDGRTPACSSVTFSYTGSDISSSSTNSCSCSTKATSTAPTTTDLCKSDLTSFKVVQTQAQVVELTSSASTSFQDLSLLDLEHDVIISNDDLLSELMPTAIIDTMGSTSLEHNYAIKPLEIVMRNEYDTQYDMQIKSEPSILQSNQKDEWNGKVCDINTTNELFERKDNANDENDDLQDKVAIIKSNTEMSTKQVPSLKVSIPLVYIKRLEELTASKDWYLAEKPSTSKAALEALAKRNAQLKSDKRKVHTRQSCCQSPSLPLKKRRNISEALEEDFYNNTAGLLSDEDNLVPVMSQSNAALTEKSIFNEKQDTNFEILNEQFTKSEPEKDFENIEKTLLRDDKRNESKKPKREKEDLDIEPENINYWHVAEDQENTKMSLSHNVIITQNAQYQNNDIEKHTNQVLTQDEETLENHNIYQTQEIIGTQHEKMCTEFAETNEDETAKKLATKHAFPTCEDRGIPSERPYNIATTHQIPKQFESSSLDVTESPKSDIAIENGDASTYSGDPTNITTTQNQLKEIQYEQAQEVAVPHQQGLTINEVYTEDTNTNMEVETKPHDLITSQQVQTKEQPPLPNYENNDNEVILTTYDDQFFVTDLNESSNVVTGFAEANNIFVSKEYAENDFDIGKDVIIRTHEPKEESAEFMNIINSPKNSPMNLTKPTAVPTFTTDTNLIADFSKSNELVGFMPNFTNTEVAAHTADLQLLTIANNSNFLHTTDITTAPPTTTQVELFASSTCGTSMSLNSMSTFTNAEFGIDHGTTNRASISDLTEIHELDFVHHDEMQMVERARSSFTEAQCQAIDAENRNENVFDGITSTLKISSNTFQAKQVEIVTVTDVCATQTTSKPTIKICSSSMQKVDCKTLEESHLNATIPTISADVQHLTQLSSLSPILPLIKPSTTTIDTTNTDYQPDGTTNSSNTIDSSTPIVYHNSPLATTTNSTMQTVITTVAAATTAENKLSNSTVDDTKSQTSSTRRSTSHQRAPARVQIVTPQRKNHHDIEPKSVEEDTKTPDVMFGSTTSAFSTAEFNAHQVASSLPASYPAKPMLSATRYANLCHFEKYIQQLMTLLDVPAIMESARNLFVDKQAYEEAHAALLAQATQFDDDGNANSQPLLLKYHKDGTISILNDNDECIILTANMSQMVRRLSFVLSILQEQQSPVLGIRGRIHALLKQLTQTATAKAEHTTNAIGGSSVIPTAVVNPRNLVENAQEMELNSGDDGGVKQPMQQQQVHLIDSNAEMYTTTWHEAETSGLLGNIANAELQITNVDQLVNIDPLPLLVDDGAADYEHAVAFDFDENPTILSSNESISAQRFENTFDEEELGEGEKNCEWSESQQAGEVMIWQQQQQQQPGCIEGSWQEDNGSSRNEQVHEAEFSGVVAEVNESGRNDLHTVETNNVDVNAIAVESDELVFEGLGAADQKRREKIKKTVFETIDEPVINVQPSNITKPVRWRKKVTARRVEKATKVHTDHLPKSVAVTTAQTQSKLSSNFKLKGQRKTSTIHHRPTPQTQSQSQAIANVLRKHDVTLSYKHTSAQTQQQKLQEDQQLQQNMTSVQMAPTQFITSNSNHLKQAPPPLITIDSVKNIQLFSQQHPQNSALGGGIQQNNNVRFLVTTAPPEAHTQAHMNQQWQRFLGVPPPSTLMPLSSKTLTTQNMPPQEAPIQYQHPQPFQLQPAQPNFGEDLQITEFQIHSLKGTTHTDAAAIADAPQPTDMTKTNAAVISPPVLPPPTPSGASTLRMVRSSRSTMSGRNTETITNFTQNLQPHNSVFIDEAAASSSRALSLLGEQPLVSPMEQAIQQPQPVHFHQQQVQCLPTTNTGRIINNVQQKHQVELEQLRQQLIRHTELQIHLAQHQQQPQAQLRVDHNQRQHGIMMPNFLTQFQPPRLITQQQQQHVPILVTHPPTRGSPTISPTKMNLTRKRGRPRKFDTSDEILTTTSTDLRKLSARDASQKYTKSKEAANLTTTYCHAIKTAKRSSTKIGQIITTPSNTYYPLNQNSLDSQHHYQHQQHVQQTPSVILEGHASTSSMRQEAEQQQQQHQLRPSFTSSANAFNLVENVIIEVEAAGAHRPIAKPVNVRPQPLSQSSPPISQQRRPHHV